MADMNTYLRKDVVGYTPYGIFGQGQYSRESHSSHATANIAAAFVAKAIDNIHFDPKCSRAFTICEFGAADGLTSLPVMNTIIDHVREKYGKGININIIYQDRPGGDFNSLFRAISGELQHPFGSYQAFQENVFVFGTGRDFFQQCVSNGSLQFAYSANALHYMSKRPCQLQDAIHIAESRDPVAKAQFASQAVQDWSTLLLHRTKELAPGGQMVLVVAVIDEIGQYAGRTLPNPQSSMHEHLARPWKEMIKEGRISQEDFAEMSFNSIHRSVEEYKAPFRDTTSDVYMAGLRLVALDTQVTPCPVHEEWFNLENKEDASCKEAYAKKAVAQMRCWNEWLFVQALKKNRPSGESIALVEEFWKRFEKLIAASLGEVRYDTPLAYIWMEKVKHM